MKRGVDHSFYVVPAEAGTQYSETLAIERIPYGVLDTRFRGHDDESVQTCWPPLMWISAPFT